MGYVLVTGCNGFIGSKLTNKLLEKGYKVLGLSSKNNTKVKHKYFKLICADITDRIGIEKIFSEFEISHVIHLAAIAHLKNGKMIDWNEFYRVNTLASKTIFQCAILNNAKIFFASTVDVYGNTDAPIINEECELNPVTDYAKSKVIAENILKKLAANDSYNYVIGRFAPVYAKDFMKDVFKRIYIKYPKVAFIVGNGYNYHFVSINNVIDFVIRWIESNGKLNGIFNICDLEPINSKDFIALEKKVGRSNKVVNIPDFLLSTLRYALDLSNLIIKNRKLNKIQKNLYKLIEPPRYSTRKIGEVMKIRWNIENTIYKQVENPNP